jgi:hypothetical protein
MKFTEEQLIEMSNCITQTLHKDLTDIPNNSHSEHDIEIFKAVATLSARAAALAILYLQEKLNVSFEEFH